MTDLCGGRGNNCRAGGCGSSRDLSIFTTTDAAFQLILEEEGRAGIYTFNGQQYHCPFIGAADDPWVVTQGYGNVIYHGSGSGDIARARSMRDNCRSASCCWSEATAIANLKDYIARKAEKKVRTVYGGSPFNVNQFSAMVSAFYNLGSFGTGANSDSGWVIRSEQYQYFCRGSLGLFINSSGCRRSGLVRRRVRECVLFWTPIDETVRLPNRNQIDGRQDIRLPPAQGYPTRVTQYYGRGRPC